MKEIQQEMPVETMEQKMQRFLELMAYEEDFEFQVDQAKQLLKDYKEQLKETQKQQKKLRKEINSGQLSITTT